MTYLDHELVAGDNANSPTSEVRGLQGASDFAVNLILGFDSDNGKQFSACLPSAYVSSAG